MTLRDQLAKRLTPAELNEYDDCLARIQAAYAKLPYTGPACHVCNDTGTWSDDSDGPNFPNFIDCDCSAGQRQKARP